MLIRRISRSMSLGKTMAMRNQRPIVSFTFDDFPHSAVSNGARILEKYGARGTFYAAGSYCGQVIDGIVQYSAGDLLALLEAGHEIGCHTFNHRRVSTLTKGKLVEEIRLNRSFIAEHIPNLELRTFAYPFGDASIGATFKLERMFSGCRSTTFGINSGTADIGRLYAVRLYNGAINEKDIARLIADAALQKSWLIFYTHDVEDEPSKFGCSPALMEYAVRAAASSDVAILPVVEALEVA
jgi:peptidoglycan/xylan/chitin deacetylase (PgdA/CDA1 family)